MKDEKKKIIETSKVHHLGTLYEQIYKGEIKQTYYLGWDKQKQKTTSPIPYIEDGFTEYTQINDELLSKKVVMLPSDATPCDITELQQEIKKHIYKYLDISDIHRQQAAWYILLSWVHDNLNTIPYLRALGDYGSGKTRYLDVIGGLCYKPMFVGGSVRSAPIYRVIDLWRGTAIFDEFTLHKTDETEDIIQILNNGFQRGKPVLRCDSNNYDKVNAFDPFGAKVLATRQQFKDKALESRCITEIIRETDRSDIPVGLGKTFFEEQLKIRI